MTLRLISAACSETGEFRAVNQDAAFAASWGAAVADGVGGGPAGDLASAALVHRLVAGGTSIADEAGLAERLRIANWDLAQHVRRDPALTGMATTFTGLWIDRQQRLLLAHTGDSRGYLLRDGVLTRQTRDDSYVQALVDRGLVSEEDAAWHPRRNVITASLRGDEMDRIFVEVREARPGDRWMLCSDGVSDYVPEVLLTSLVASAPDASTAAQTVVAMALEAGTRDNATAVVCDIDDSEAGTDDVIFAGAAHSRFTETDDDRALA